MNFPFHYCLKDYYNVPSCTLKLLLFSLAFQGRDSGLASVATLGSSLDYTRSRSSLKLFLPLASYMKDKSLTIHYDSCMLVEQKYDEDTLSYCCIQADPAQVLNVPVPFGALVAAVHHLATRTHVLSWLKPQISAQDLQPELYEKLVLNNFCKSTYTDILLSICFRAFRTALVKNAYN